jgi:hypothetical protein
MPNHPKYYSSKEGCLFVLSYLDILNHDNLHCDFDTIIKFSMRKGALRWFHNV